MIQNNYSVINVKNRYRANSREEQFHMRAWSTVLKTNTLSFVLVMWNACNIPNDTGTHILAELLIYLYDNLPFIKSCMIARLWSILTTTCSKFFN